MGMICWRQSYLRFIWPWLCLPLSLLLTRRLELGLRDNESPQGKVKERAKSKEQRDFPFP